MRLNTGKRTKTPVTLRRFSLGIVEESTSEDEKVSPHLKPREQPGLAPLDGEPDK